jgi:hypothetical protein
MTLTIQDTVLLQTHLLQPNHPLLENEIANNNYDAILTWYSEMGGINDPGMLFSLLLEQEQIDFLAIKEFQDWFKDYLITLKTKTNTDPSNIPGLTVAQVKEFTISTFLAVAELKMTGDWLIRIVDAIVRKSYKTKLSQGLFGILIALTESGTFSTQTFIRFKTEMLRDSNNNPIPRWQALGLSKLPTVPELMGVF